VFQLLDYLILALPVAAAVSILVYWRMRLWRKAT
jgi:hypothetical protein